MGEKLEEGNAHGNLGRAYLNIGDFQRAINYHEQHLKIAREVGDRTGEATAYGDLGNAYYMLGDFQKSIDYSERTLKIAREVGDTILEGQSYCNLGGPYHALGDYQKAKDFFELHLKIARKVGDKAGEGKAYGNLGFVEHSLGNLQKAIDYSERQLKIAKEVGDKAEVGKAYCTLGRVYLVQGEFQKAKDYIKQYLQIAIEVGHRVLEGKAYCNLGNVELCLGDFRTAIKYQEQYLKITREVGERPGERVAYENLGHAYFRLGDFQKALGHYERHLKIAEELGDRAGEGQAYGNLGNVFSSLGDFQKAIDYHERSLNISREVGNKEGEGAANCNLGSAYYSLGDFQHAKENHERHLNICKEVGNRVQEGSAYCNLGIVFDSLGDFQKGIDYKEQHLKISRELGDKTGEGSAYGNLGISYRRRGDFQKAIEYLEQGLKIAREVGDRTGEGKAYGNLGEAYHSVGDFQKAKEYYERELEVSRELGDRKGEGISYSSLGYVHENLGIFEKAIQYYKNSIRIFDHMRSKLISNDEWKISLGSTYDHVYSQLWKLLFEKGKLVEALLAADKGRAQALNDLLELKYGIKGFCPEIETVTATSPEILNCLPENSVFIGLNEEEIVFWVNKNGKEIKSKRKQIDVPITTYFQTLLEITFEVLGVRAYVNCEDRSLNNPRDETVSDERSNKKRSDSSLCETNPLKTLYDVVIDPIKDFIQGDEVVVVPPGPLFLVPYAAFMDLNSKYLCETLRIRLLPSLSSLRLIINCPADWHSKTGALLVGDPWVQEVRYNGTKLSQLKWAEKEVKMIGEILQTTPLVGKQATKDEVLRRISSVALVHIAAHGKMETGEIALAPNTTRSSLVPVKEDYLLTMKDVLKAQIRARLVVLSCCHSARGEIKAEGVVGIARAFLGAGARSVLVSLWAIDDEATMEFMKVFYQQLVNGRSASEALNKAMKSMRESVRFNAVMYWAPFVLIGDDVTVEFEGNK